MRCPTGGSPVAACAGSRMWRATVDKSTGSVQSSAVDRWLSALPSLRCLSRQVDILRPRVAPSPPEPAHSPRMSRSPVERHPDRGIKRPVGDLAVTDLDHDRVDEDRRVDLV